MKVLSVLLALLVAAPAFASVKFIDKDGVDLGPQGEVKCGYGLTCSQISGRLYLDPQSQVGSVSAALQTLTASDCGKTIVQGATTAITELLPEASTVPGCQYSFVSKLQGNFMIKPFAAPDSIQNLTTATGASVISSTSGNSLVLRAVDADTWMVVGSVGAWNNNR